MATDLKNKLTYHRRLFLLLLGISWLLVGCFMLFQYGREKRFKAERLNARLQLLNLRLLNAQSDGISPARFVEEHPGEFDSLRITMIDPAGNVVYDSAGDRLSNHRRRPEVAAALACGTGYTIDRLSESTSRHYFYAAMRGDSLVMRTAVPYSVPLREVLAADRDFLWFMLGVTLLTSVTGYFATRRLGHSIVRLKQFAQKAERGEVIAANESFPHDELGDISNNIVRLYARLQKTTADRDREHERVLHEQQEKIRIKKQLTHNINHELKTPVAAIRGYLETLLANEELDAGKRRNFLEKSLAQSTRLEQLLCDVSTLTRMDEAGHLIRRERVALNEILDDIAAEVALLPPERRMRIHRNFTEPLEIEGDPQLLTSVFRNLTDNATAYSSGRDIYIQLLSEDAERYTFRFADNGIGIDREHLPHLFERFYRVDKGRSRRQGGTGLGLSIVRNAVQLHGGEIEVRNREQGGLEFIFSLRKHS